ncbi:MAG: translation elongation factor Ts [Spirochaetes bacterium GWB1_36_13]|nr:MAG: translation elongation factor Ts [Spirochaetes bacterium GWB1_36_13]
MLSISVKDIQEVRRRTGAGLMDSKKALTEANGDFDKAIELLKEWGISKASKKSGREASEGVLVAVVSNDGKKGALIEVNCETDFVAKTDEFKAFAKKTAEMVFNKGFDSQEGFDEETSNAIKEGIAKFGENILVNSIKKMSVNGKVFAYIHTNLKLGTMISVETNMASPKIDEMGNDVAVHATANQIAGVSKDDIEKAIIDKKLAEYTEELKGQGKPENIIQKIVDGKMNKFYKEETLLAQPFLKNEDITVEEFVKSVAKETGAVLKIVGFIKTAIGE